MSEPCDVCCGAGVPVSKKPCICKGTGTVIASQDRINIYLIKSIERMFIGLGVLTFTVLLLIGALLLVVS